MLISVVCPIYNEEKYIEACIHSILEQDIDKDNLEVLFVDGMSSDRTREIVAQYTEQYSWIQLLDNPKRIAPSAMNIGIKASKGDIIVRLDAHCIYPIDYISKLVEALNKYDADNVGGLCITLPTNDTPKAHAIATALSTKFGMGNSLFRIGYNKDKKVSTVPFGCFPRSVFDKVGYYDEDLVRGQDYELNGRIIKSGGEIYLIPSIVCKYYARDTIRKVSKMFYQYGLFKPLANKKMNRVATLRQCIPPLFILGLVIGAILSLFFRLIAIIYLTFVSIYLLLDIAASFNRALLFKEKIWLIPIYPIIHLSYGWGYLIGIYKVLFNQSYVVECNR